jgi:hypothetical protein
VRPALIVPALVLTLVGPALETSDSDQALSQQGITLSYESI